MAAMSPVPLTLTAAPTTSAPALLLRPWEATDAEALATAFQDPEMRMWLRTCIDDESEARRWIEGQAEAWSAGTRFSFAVMEEGADTEPLGQVVVKEVSPGISSAEVGYWTVRAARGRGIAPRALDAVAHWALTEHPLHRLELIHALDNVASCRVANKCAFIQHAVLPPQPPSFPSTGHLHVRLREAL